MEFISCTFERMLRNSTADVRGRDERVRLGSTAKVEDIVARLQVCKIEVVAHTREGLDSFLGDAIEIHR